MAPFRLRFVIGKLTEDEFLALQTGEPIITKMLLTPDDFKVFHYKENDEIEAATHDGNRLWATITNMEIIADDLRVIIIFTLLHGESNRKPGHK
jgi:hypothetical protein